MLSWSQWISGVLPEKWNIVAVGYDSILRQGGLLFGGLAARLYCFCKQDMVHRTLPGNSVHRTASKIGQKWLKCKAFTGIQVARSS